MLCGDGFCESYITFLLLGFLVILLHWPALITPCKVTLLVLIWGFDSVILFIVFVNLLSFVYLSWVLHPLVLTDSELLLLYLLLLFELVVVIHILYVDSLVLDVGIQDQVAWSLLNFLDYEFSVLTRHILYWTAFILIYFNFIQVFSSFSASHICQTSSSHCLFIVYSLIGTLNTAFSILNISLRLTIRNEIILSTLPAVIFH